MFDIICNWTFDAWYYLVAGIVTAVFCWYIVYGEYQDKLNVQKEFYLKHGSFEEGFNFVSHLLLHILLGFGLAPIIGVVFGWLCFPFIAALVLIYVPVKKYEERILGKMDLKRELSGK